MRKMKPSYKKSMEIKSMQIKKTTHKQIKNDHATFYDERTHHIVTHEDGNIEYYLDIQLEEYLYYNASCETEYPIEVYIQCEQTYCDRGFFISDANYQNITAFEKEFGHLFEKALINMLRLTIDVMNEENEINNK